MAVQPACRGARAWIEQGAAAIFWGGAVVLVFDEFFWVVALGLFGYEFFRARRYGFFPGILLHAGLVALIIAAAVAVPLKSEDVRRIELPDSSMSLSALGGIHPFHWDKAPSDRIRLPSRTPTLREVMGAIENQTAYHCLPGRCGNGISFLRGGHIIGISLEHK